MAGPSDVSLLCLGPPCVDVVLSMVSNVEFVKINWSSVKLYQSQERPLVKLYKFQGEANSGTVSLTAGVPKAHSVIVDCRCAQS